MHKPRVIPDTVFQGRKMDKKKVSGFDLGPTLAWYEQHALDIQARLPKQVKRRPNYTPDFTITGRESSIFGLNDIYGILNLFPQAARKRMKLNEVHVAAPLWFAHDALPNMPKVTKELSEALTPTAIVPSFVEYGPKKVTVYAMDESVPAPVQKIVYMEALTHEFAHLVTVFELYSEKVTLLIKGKKTDAFDWFANFANLVDDAGPISHYASAYCDEAGKLLAKPDPLLPINEAMAECIAARLLNFAFRLDRDGGLEPFGKHPELRQAVDDYLHAQRVS